MAEKQEELRAEELEKVTGGVVATMDGIAIQGIGSVVGSRITQEAISVLGSDAISVLGNDLICGKESELTCGNASGATQTIARLAIAKGKDWIG